MAMQRLFVPLFVTGLWAVLVGACQMGFGGVGRGRIREAGGGGSEGMAEGVKDARGAGWLRGVMRCLWHDL